MRKPYIFPASILAMFLTSCLATSGDLQRITDQMRAGEQAIAEKQAEFAAGLATAEEVTDTIKDAWGDNLREVEQVAEDVKERGESILDEAMIAVLTTLTGGVGLNMYRNRTRSAALKGKA